MMNGGTTDNFEKKPFTPPVVIKPKYELEKRDIIFSLLCLAISIIAVIHSDFLFPQKQNILIRRV